MLKNLLHSLHVIPKANNPMFAQREEGISHTSYRDEVAFYSLVQQGNTKLVKQSIEKFVSTQSVVMGRLSNNSLKQIQYWAVCCITLGIRSAIKGGVDEMLAFNLSDSYIMKIDSFTQPNEVLEYLSNIVLELTQLVHDSGIKDCPPKIRQCINYIDLHLHENIQLPAMAEELELSPDHLSKCFKKALGVTLKSYILNKKLDEARNMLLNNTPHNMIAYYLGFCSQTHFIKSFKKKFGLPPQKYFLQNK